MTHEVYRHHVLARITLAATGRTPAPGRDLLSGGAPCYGEDNDYVYGELLGMSSQEIKALADEGVI